MNPATHDELQAMVRAGRLGHPMPEIELNAAGEVERDRPFSVRYRVTNAEAAALQVVAPSGIITRSPINNVGQRRLNLHELGLHRIVVTAAPRAAARQRRRHVRREVLVEVVAPKPAIRLDVAGIGVIFEDLPVGWDSTDATAVTLEMDGEAIDRALAGRRILRPDRLGTIEVAVDAVGEGGRTRASHTVRIVAPPVGIDVPTVVEGYPGDLVVIPFSFSGTAERHLDRKELGERPQPLPVKGVIEVEVACEPQHLQLLGVGHDRRSNARTVTVQARLLDFPNIAEDLALLDRF